MRFTSFFYLSLLRFQPFLQVTKALRESRGIALLCFSTLALEGVRGQRHAPTAFYPRERPDTHCTGGWWVLGPDWTGAENLATVGIRSPDRSARNQLLYGLSYLAHIFL
jgi:hypothetical protein